jgi:hypothetical protein
MEAWILEVRMDDEAWKGVVRKGICGVLYSYVQEEERSQCLAFRSSSCLYTLKNSL